MITDKVYQHINYFNLLRAHSQELSTRRIEVSLRTRQTQKPENLKHKLLKLYSEHIAANVNKKAILITSRVHPGEMQSSFAVEGIIDFLLSDDAHAVQLRQNYIIYIVPMLNIDGVIHGNQRTNLAGLDLNRVWDKPSIVTSPIIYATKKLAEIIATERKIEVYCDIHGHFQPLGGFMFCNSFDKGQGVIPSQFVSDANLRVIPYLLT
jgi:murein tripeptide amidase MpaA